MRRRRRAEAPAGLLAWFNGDCSRCPNPIVEGQSQVVRRPGGSDGYIHAGCASGADE